LLSWNDECDGAIWAACHSVSVLENVFNPGSPSQGMNFLMSNGLTPGNAAVPYGSHADGSIPPPFLYDHHAHPVMQFMGNLDVSSQNGSEQIYLPRISWRPSTLIGVWDNSQADVPSKSPGPAGVLVFGQGFGANTRGRVAYQGGHSINKAATAPYIAAQRAFFNFSFWAAETKAIIVNVTTPATMNIGVPYTVSASASGGGGAPYTYEWTSSCPGTFANPIAATTTFTPSGISSGCIITCRVRDNCGTRVGFGSSNPIIITPAPQPPVALNDNATVPSSCGLGGSVTIDILANDSDTDTPKGDLTITLLGNGSGGTFVLNPNGTVTYTANSNFAGSDLVQYQICDPGNLCATATITISVGAPNIFGCLPNQIYGIESDGSAEAALIANSVSGTIDNVFNQPDATVVELDNNSDELVLAFSETINTGDTITLFLQRGDSSNPTTLTVERSPDGLNFFNLQSINITSATILPYTYIVTGGNLTSIRLKRTAGKPNIDAVTYNKWRCLSAVPNATDDEGIVALEDAVVTINVLSNDVDPKGETLTVSRIITSPANGRVSLNLNNSITYLNNQDYSGNDSFVYEVCNTSGYCAQATVFVTVREDNCTTPGQTRLQSGITSTLVLGAAATLDTHINNGNPNENKGNDSELRIGKEAGSAKRILMRFDLSSVPLGSIITGANLQINRTSSSKAQAYKFHRLTESWTESGATWNSRNGTNNWSPSAGGTFIATPFASLNPGTTTGIKTVGITSAVQFWVDNAASNFGFLAKRELENNGDEHRWGSSENSNALRQPQLTVTYIALGDCQPTPNRSPLANPDAVTTNSVTPVAINVMANDFEPDSNPMTVTGIISAPPTGSAALNVDQTITYTPNPTFNGKTTFTYRVCDNQSPALCDTARVTLTILNSPPAANNDNVSVNANSSININVQANDSDPELQPLVTSLVAAPANGTAVLSGNNIIYTPSANYFGPDAFQYQICEIAPPGSCNPPYCATATVNVTVNSLPPDAINDAVNINPCQSILIGVLDNDLNPLSQPLALTIFSTPANGTVEIIGSEILYTPNDGFTGPTDVFTYQICNNASPVQCDQATVTINFNYPILVNNQPVANNDAESTFSGVTGYVKILENDFDPDGNELVVTIGGTLLMPANGAINLLPNNQIEYIPNPGFSGTDQFEYQICDVVVSSFSCVPANILCDLATVTITVINQLVAVNDFAATAVNTTINIPVMNNDFDPEGNSFFITGIGTDGSNGQTANGGTISINDNGTPGDPSDDFVQYTPPFNYAGQDTFRYIICDTGIVPACSEAEVVITITPPIDLAVQVSVNQPNALIGQNVIFTVDLTNEYIFTATGVAVKVDLPSSFTYVSDDGSGFYDPVTGLWYIGNINPAEVKSLNITATVNDYLNPFKAQVFAADQSDLDSTPNNMSGAPAEDDESQVIVFCNATPELTCPANQTIVTSNNGTGDCTGKYAIPDPLGENCVNANWGISFSANPNGNPVPIANIPDGTGSGDITFQKGATTVTLSATDAGSNTLTSCTFTVTLNDDENPALTCPANQTIVTSNNGAGDCTGVYTIPNPMTDNCPGGLWSATFSGNPNGNPAAISVANGTNAPVTFQKGTTTVTLTATDAQGNNAVSCSFTVTLNDDENPALTCPANQTIVTSNNGTGDCTGVYATPSPMTDNCPGGLWSATFSGNPTGNPANLTNLANGSGSGDITFQKGTTTVTLTATDAQGNNAVSCSFTVTLNDDENPALTCPANQTIVTSNNGTGDCTGVYTIPNPMTDNCPGGLWSATFSGNPNGNPAAISVANGTNAPVTFQKGTTTVTLTATDAQGNNAVSCSFTVTLNDDENPALTCPANQTIVTSNNGTGDCTGVYAIPSPMTDNCPGGLWSATFSGNPNGNPAAISVANGTNAPVTFQKGVTTVTLTATDAQGNNAVSCSFTVTLNDDENPALTCPANQTIVTSNNGTGDCTGVYATPSPMTDNCPGGLWSATFSGNPTGNPANLTNLANGSGSGDITFQKGTTTVTLTATDAQGNNAVSCSFTVTLNDDENPALTCPANQTIVTSNNGTGDCTGVYAIPSPMTDNCPGGTWSATFSGNPTGNPANLTNLANGSGSGDITFQKGTTTVTLTATDAQGNNAVSCSFTVTLNDDENPALTCPANQTIVTSNNGTGDCTGVYAIPSPMTDNCPGGTWSATFSGNPTGNPANLTNLANGSGSGDITFQKGTTTVTLTATDAQGNNAVSCSFTVTLNDDEAPNLICPANTDVVTSNNGIGECTAQFNMPNPVTDNCPGGFWSATFSGNPNGVPPAQNNIPFGSNLNYALLQKGATTITLLATDASGNTASCSFVATVIDDEPPMLYCSINQIATTSSNGTGDCTGKYTIVNPLADNCPGATWGAVFTGNTNGLPANFVGIPEGSNSAELTIYPGTTSVTLIGVDAQGNIAATCDFTITLLDNEIPTLTCPTNQTVPTSSNGTNDCTGSYNIPSPITDNCPGATWSILFSDNPNGYPANISGITAGNNSGSLTFQHGATTVTLIGTDSGGNSATCSFTVTVADDENPALTCPANQNLTPINTGQNCTANYNIPSPLFDNCNGALWSITFSGNPNGFPPPMSNFSAGDNSGFITFQQGTTTVTLSAADATGNNAINCSFTVSIDDTVPPVVVCPANVTQTTVGAGICTAPVTFTLPPATDNCTASSLVTSVPASGSVFGIGATTVTVTATDLAGNTATCEFTVTVKDALPPTAVCPMNITKPVDMGVCGATVDYLLPDATDDCTPNPMKVASPTSGTFFPAGTTTVTVTATDASGNTGTCEFTVTVNNSVTPDISGPTEGCGSVTLLASGGNSYQWSGGASPNSAANLITTSGTYIVTVTDANGCSAAKSIDISITPLTSNTVTVSTCNSYTWALNGQTYTTSGIYTKVTGCHTDILDLTIEYGVPTTNTVDIVACGSYFWAKNAQTYTASGIYSHTVGCQTDVLNLTMLTGNNIVGNITGTTSYVCAGDVINTTAHGGSQYQWSGPGGFSANTANFVRPNAGLLEQGLYTVTISGVGCTPNIIDFWITVNPKPSDVILGNANICTGNTLSLTASGGAIYEWSGPDGYAINTTSPTIARLNATTAMSGLYTVTITSENGCVTVTNKMVTVSEAPLVSISGTTGVCWNEEINLTATSGSVVSYQWSGPGGFTASGANITQTAGVGSAGAYTVTATAANGCTSVAGVVVNLSPIVQADIVGAATYCEGETVSLIATGGVSYQWDVPDGLTTTGAQVVIPNATTAHSGNYWVTVTDAVGCSAVALKKVSVNARPEPEILGDTIHCQGGFLSLTALGGMNYAWSGPNGYAVNTATMTRANLTPDMSGTYTVTVTNASYCTTLASVEVSVAAQPDVVISGPTTVCTNGSIILEASGGDSYQWVGPGGYTASGATLTRTATTGTGGFYAVTVTNANGCTGSASVIVSLIPASVVTANISGVTTYCEDNTITLTASGGVSYEWSGPNGYTSLGATLSVPNVATDMAGVYVVTVTNAGGCFATASRTVTVNPAPEAVITGNTSVCVGSTLVLSASGGVAYQWSGPGFSNSGATISRTNVTLVMAGTYTVTVTNATGCKSTASVVVAVNPKPTPAITGTTIVCLGATITLTATGGDTYQWSGPGGFSASGATMTRPATSGANGTYTVTVTNSNGCTASVAATVGFSASTFTAGINGATAFCEGNAITLTATASGGVNYQWSGPAGFSFSGAALSIPNATTAMSGTYIVTVTNAGGCTASASRAVTVNAMPVANIAGNTTYCAGSTITLAASGGISYQWSGPGFIGSTATINRINATTTMSGIYTVTVTGAGGCKSTASVNVLVNPKPMPLITGATTVCMGGTINLTASGGDTYQWLGPGGFTASTAAITRTAVTGTSGNYNVTVTNSAGCTTSASVAVTITTAGFTPGITGATTYCAGSNISLTASGGVSYEWSGPGGFSFTGAALSIPDVTTAMSGIYIVTITNAGGCTASASRAVTVNAMPVATITGSTTYCAGSTITLTASGGISYQWSGPGFSATTATINRTNATAVMAGTYTVTVTGTGGCKATAGVVVIVNPKPTPALTGATSFCSGSTITINASGGVNYQWSGPGGFTATGSVLERPNATTAMGGNYVVTVTNAAGCTSSAVRSISILASPTATITGNQNVCLNGTITLQASGGTSYVWLAPDGFTANTALLSRPFANTTMSGAYTVTVTASNGCKATASSVVTVGACKGTDEVSPETITATTLGAYPNPTDGLAFVSFTSATKQHLLLSVYAVDGREVAVLFNAQAEAQTEYTLELDLRELPVGTYFAVLQQADGSRSQVRLMVVR